MKDEGGGGGGWRKVEEYGERGEGVGEWGVEEKKLGGRGEGEEVERGRRERGGGEEDAMEGVGRSKEEDEGGEGSLFFLPLSDSPHLPSSLPPTFTPSLLLLLPLILTPLNFSPFFRHSSLIHGSNKGKTKSKTPIPSLKKPQAF